MGIFEKILVWFLENLINIALVIVGATAFITYILENKRKVKTAATLIVKQIDEIEKAVNILRTAKSLDDNTIFRSKQIIAENYWYQYRHLLLRKMKYSQIIKIEEFYSQVEEIEKCRAFIVNESIATVNSKNLVYQLKVSEEIIKTGAFYQNVSPLTQYYNTGASFLSNIPREYLDELLRVYEKIVDTNDGIEAYSRLKKISYFKGC